MRELIFVVVLLACVGALNLPSAEAAQSVPRLQAHVGQSIIPVHCRRTYHCKWDGDAKVKRCHVCG